MIFVVCFSKCMTPKGHRGIKGSRDQLYDLKGHGDLYDRFGLVFDLKRVIRGRRDLLYNPKGHGYLYDQLVLDYDPAKSRVSRGRRDLLYHPKGHGDIFGRFDLIYDRKKITGSLDVAVTYFMTRKVTVMFVVCFS